VYGIIEIKQNNASAGASEDGQLVLNKNATLFREMNGNMYEVSEVMLLNCIQLELISTVYICR
jgi:hypothetical protein